MNPAVVSVTAEIDGRELDCLVDTGAAISMVNVNALKGPIQGQCDTAHHIRSVDGRKLKTYNQIVLPIRIGTLSVNHEFIVADFEGQAIMGADFLLHHNMNVNLGSARLEWPRNHFPLSIKTSFPVASAGHISQESLKSIVNEFDHLFSVDGKVGTTNVVEHEIYLTSSSPIKCQTRRIPFHLQDEINEQLAKMLARGIIQESNSSFAAPVLLVPKKDGSYRFCVDYRRLNAATKKDAMPIPRVDEILGSQNIYNARLPVGILAGENVFPKSRQDCLCGRK